MKVNPLFRLAIRLNNGFVNLFLIFLCHMENLKSLHLENWLNQIKQNLLLKTDDLWFFFQARVSPVRLLSVAGSGGAYVSHAFLEKEFTRQASGFFHIDAEVDAVAPTFRPSISRKTKNRAGKILVFPFVFVLILLDELMRRFHRKNTDNLTVYRSENSYEQRPE